MIFVKQLIIAIEGIDGAGKSTICREIKDRLGDSCSIYSRTEKSQLVHTLLTHFPIKQAHILQIPIYIFLGHFNYWVRRKQLQVPVILMDRCFLSNVCYYYPYALKYFVTFALSLSFEVKLFPSRIFIIDELADIAWERDNCEKSLSWLNKVRTNYLEVIQHKYASSFQMQIVPASYSLEQKIEYVYHIIKIEMEKENGT